MANDYLAALARDIAFACRDGRKARESGATTVNPYLVDSMPPCCARAPHGSEAMAAHVRRCKLFQAWSDGWRMADRKARDKGKRTAKATKVKARA